MSETSNVVFGDVVEIEVGEFIDEDDSFYFDHTVDNSATDNGGDEKIKKKRKVSKDFRQSRGKFSLRWEREFPWVRADNIDESVGLCTICKKKLVCKKSHLERHEKSYKHQRMLAGTQRSDDNEGTHERSSTKYSVDYLDGSSCKLDWTDDEVEEQTIDTIEFDSELCEDIDIKLIPKNDLSCNSQSTDDQDDIAKQSERSSNKINRYALLKRIDRSRSKLHDYYNARQTEGIPAPQVVMAPARDSFDLFFDSVSATVKTLPPKLAAEVKSRVSQLIAEFEVRAICEREAAMARTESYSIQPVVQNVVQDQNNVDTPQILYTFQQKVEQ